MSPRPPGQGAPREARRFDQTYLSLDGVQMVHRDYAAHYFRWGFARRFCVGKTVLEVGCGPERPLHFVLCRHGEMGARPTFYLGVDLSPLKAAHSKLYDFWGELDFTTDWQKVRRKHGAFEVVCSFEVIEHMDVADGARLLDGMRRCLVRGGTLLLSTPRNEGHKPARNHLHEYDTSELHSALVSCGFNVVRRYGTFGDVVKLRQAASAEHRQVMADLSTYYDNHVISTFLAPLYPDACKNNLWVCTRRR